MFDTVSTNSSITEMEHCFPVRILKSGLVRRMTVTVIVDDLSQLEQGYQTTYFSELSKDFIRDFLKTYTLHVKSNTLVDIRECPFLSTVAAKIFFIFIHDCKMSNSQAEIGKISSQTEILIRNYHDVSYFSRITSTLLYSSVATLQGSEIVYRELCSAFESQYRTDEFKIKNKFFGFLLGGASGSGKTSVVREVARLQGAKLLNCNLGNEEKSMQHEPYKVAADLMNIFTKAKQSTTHFEYPIVMLLENLDVLHVKDDGVNHRSLRNKKSITNLLCDLLDDARTDLETKALFVVVATTSKPYLIPEKLRLCSRLHREVFIKAPDLSHRIKILKSLQQENPVLCLLDIEYLAKRTPAYVAADLIRLVHFAIMKAHESNAKYVTEANMKQGLNQVTPSVLRHSIGVMDIQQCTDSLDYIAGLDAVKMDLIKTILWPVINPEAFRRMGIIPSKGIMLYGPSGCGKTTLVRAVASYHHTNFLSVSSAELFCSGVGDSEKIISHLFHRARLASPCIFFIDELDAVVGSRDAKSSGKSMSETILSMLLTELDGVGAGTPIARSIHENDDDISFEQRVIVVGATNRPDMIDAALLRPGRFDRLVPVPPPNENDRLKLLQICTKKTPLSDDVRLEDLALKTKRFSGADIINLCREAGLFALSEDMNVPFVSMKHYERALANLSPSISQEYLDSFYQYASRGSCVTQDLTNEMKSLHLS